MPWRLTFMPAGSGFGAKYPPENARPLRAYPSCSLRDASALEQPHALRCSPHAGAACPPMIRASTPGSSGASEEACRTVASSM